MTAKRAESSNDDSSQHSDDHMLPAPPCVAIDPKIIEEMRADLKSLREAVGGNDFGNPGLIKRIMFLEESNRLHTQRFILWGGIVTGVGFALQYVKTIFR